MSFVFLTWKAASFLGDLFRPLSRVKISGDCFFLLRSFFGFCGALFSFITNAAALKPELFHVNNSRVRIKNGPGRFVLWAVATCMATHKQSKPRLYRNGANESLKVARFTALASNYIFFHRGNGLIAVFQWQ